MPEAHATLPSLRELQADKAKAAAGCVGWLDVLTRHLADERCIRSADLDAKLAAAAAREAIAAYDAACAAESKWLDETRP